MITRYHALKERKDNSKCWRLTGNWKGNFLHKRRAHTVPAPPWNFLVMVNCQALLLETPCTHPREISNLITWLAYLQVIIIGGENPQIIPCPLAQSTNASNYKSRRMSTHGGGRIEQIGRRIGTDSQNSGERVRSEAERCREKEGGDTHLAGVTEKLSDDRRQWARRRV